MNDDETCERSIFAKRLTSLRQENGYTQETFAQKVGFSRGRYANYEQGRREPDFEIVKTFADVLNCSVDYLLGTNNSNDLSPNLSKTNILQKEDKKPKDLIKFLEQSEVMFDGETYTLDEDDKKKLRDALEYAFWHAKQKNKRNKKTQ